MAYQVRSTAKRHIVELHGDVIAEIANCYDFAEATNIAYLLNNQPNTLLFPTGVLRAALAAWDAYEPDISTGKMVEQANAMADAIRVALEAIMTPAIANTLMAQGSQRIEELRAARDRLVAVLDRCADYFEERADAECFPDSPSYSGNEEMGLLVEIREELRRAK